MTLPSVDAEISAKVELLMRADKTARAYDPRIKEVRAGYADELRNILVVASDGTFAEDLRLDFDAPLVMNGRSVILQASRKIPSAIGELLERNSKTASAVKVFLMHQANQNLMDRVAKALAVDPSRFYSNIRRYGNTSSASMLIAAAEWWHDPGPNTGDLICFAAFGAGFHWGALLAQCL